MPRPPPAPRRAARHSVRPNGDCAGGGDVHAIRRGRHCTGIPVASIIPETGNTARPHVGVRDDVEVTRHRLHGHCVACKVGNARQVSREDPVTRYEGWVGDAHLAAIGTELHVVGGEGTTRASEHEPHRADADRIERLGKCQRNGAECGAAGCACRRFNRGEERRAGVSAQIDLHNGRDADITAGVDRPNLERGSRGRVGTKRQAGREFKRE